MKDNYFNNLFKSTTKTSNYMIKCNICGNKIEHTFLNKVLGTYIKKGGKKITICFECQKKFKTKEEILIQIK